MKKILIATTALVATAGMAAAEISFGGYGRFGVVYEDNDAYGEKTSLDQRFRLTITATTETDNGVKLEGRFRLQTDDEEGENSASGMGPGAAGFAVSTGGFRLDVGHVSDVLDSADTFAYTHFNIGLTDWANQRSSFVGFDKNGFDQKSGVQQRVKARYTAGDFVASAAYTPEAGASEYWQIGAGYNFGPVHAGFTYGDNEDNGDYWVVGLNGAAGDLAYAVIVGDSEAQDDVSYGGSVKYAVSSATSLMAAVSISGIDSTDDTYAVGFAHSLGGGVSLLGGVGQKSNGNTRGDFGIKFSF